MLYSYSLMQRVTDEGELAMREWGIVLYLIMLFAGPAFAQEGDQSANIDIRSTLVGTRVYLEDTYVGDADLFLDNVPPGDHMVIMRQGSQRINGQFAVKAGETLMLEGRFEENRIVDLKKVAREDAVKRAEAERKAEEERKAEADLKKKEHAAAVPDKKKTDSKKIVAAVAKPSRSAADHTPDQQPPLNRVGRHI